MSIQEELPALPTEHHTILRLSPLMTGLQERNSVCQVITPAGDPAWLVTRHAEVKQLMRDERLGRWHPDLASASKYVNNPLLDMLIVDNAEAAREAHTQTRTLLAPVFAARRMLKLQPRVQEIAEEILESFIAKGKPADLQTQFSMPFSLSVLWELVGVPPVERDYVSGLVKRVGGLDDEKSAEEARNTFFGYLMELVTRKKADPGDDVTSYLTTTGITDQEVCGHVAGLLFAGAGGVANQIGLGVVQFAAHPEQRDAMMSDPDVLANAVEESLRTSHAGTSMLPRYATQDFEVAGAHIKAGDLVLLNFTLSNFDPRVFEEPERFDITRSPNPHMSFGHGMWHCIGAPLVRVELKIAFSLLFGRLPELRPAVSVDEIRPMEGQLAGGVGELPVTW